MKRRQFDKLMVSTVTKILFARELLDFSNKPSKAEKRFYKKNRAAVRTVIREVDQQRESF